MTFGSRLAAAASWRSPPLRVQPYFFASLASGGKGMLTLGSEDFVSFLRAAPDAVGFCRALFEIAAVSYQL